MIALLVITSLLGLTAHQPVAVEDTITNGLEYGSHAVGVQIASTQDSTRTITVDGEKQPRPIQITIWYPAQPDSSQAKMTEADFIGYKASEFHPGNNDTAARAAIVEASKENMLGAGADKADIDRKYAAETRSVLNAEPAPGKFPLLVYAPGYGESPSENIILCEYLASHGYVVASCPSMGANSREMTNDAAGVRAQALDLAFVLKQMKNTEFMDMELVGTFGFSWGGMANVLFAMGNDSIKALASLDGSMAFTRIRRIVDSLEEFKPERLSAPFIYLSSFHRDFQQDPHDYFFLEAATNAERYLVKLHGLGHGNFSGSFVTAFPFFSDEVRRGVEPERAKVGYQAVCFYLLNFFDAHLKSDTSAKEVFTQTPEKNGFDNSLISIRRW